MSLLLCCDAPDCFRTIQPVVKLNRPAAPDGWWMTCVGDRVLCACSEAHLNIVIKQRRPS